MLDLSVTTTEPADVDADLIVLAVGDGELERGALLARTDARACEIAAEGALLGGYRFEKYLTDERSRPAGAAAFVLRPPGTVSAADAESAFARARSTARAVMRARDLVNEPAGTLTPSALA